MTRRVQCYTNIWGGSGTTGSHDVAAIEQKLLFPELTATSSGSAGYEMLLPYFFASTPGRDMAEALSHLHINNLGQNSPSVGGTTGHHSVDGSTGLGSALTSSRCRTGSLSPTQQSLLPQTHKVPGRWDRSRLLLPQAACCCCGANADPCPQRRLEAEASCVAETPPHSSRERSLMTYSSVGVVFVCV